jgi:hypothetical protein
MDWHTKQETTEMKRRCGACWALVTIETNGTADRLDAHYVGNHKFAPVCVASYSTDPDMMRSR